MSPSSYCGHTRNHGWKVGRDLKGNGYRPPSYSSPITSPSPVIAPPPFHPFPFPSLLFFPSLLLKLSKEVWESTVSFPQCPAKKCHPVAKVGGDQIYTRSPWSPKLQGTRPTGPMGRLHLWVRHWWHLWSRSMRQLNGTSVLRVAVRLK